MERAVGKNEKLESFKLESLKLESFANCPFQLHVSPFASCKNYCVVEKGQLNIDFFLSNIYVLEMAPEFQTEFLK